MCPTHEAVVDSVVPKQVEKPIPTRTVSTRFSPRPTEIAGQPITNNSPAAESATLPAESVRLSAQVSAIARKEQAYRQREQALKEREKAIEAKLLDADKFGQLKEKISAKDFSEAEALGLNYEEYTKYVLNKEGGEDPKEARIRALEERLAAKEKDEETSAANQYEETVNEYRNEVERLVSENPDFSTVKGIEGGSESVLQLVLDVFEDQDKDEEGKFWYAKLFMDGEKSISTTQTINRAAQVVEDKLMERGKIYTSLPKFKTTNEEAKPQEVEQRMLPRPMVGRTLTNDMTVNSEKRPLKSLQHLSESERYAEARRRVVERREGK